MSRTTKTRQIAGAQLNLYRPVDDRAVFENAGDLLKQQKTAEEITARNRVAAAQSLFVIKKHDATHLHYDLRLESNRAMVSWAIPDGPSYCPEHKRKPVQVEDHAREYAGFEGMIPEGRPGAGTVMPWDSGTWQLQSGGVDAGAALRDGTLKFTMHGQKLKGGWMLVRTGRKQGDRQDPIWLLSKDDDEFARASDEPDILKEAPDSVLKGRSLKEIAQEWTAGKRMSTSQAGLFDNIPDEE